MWRQVRAALVPAVCVLIATGGASYGFTSALSPAGNEFALRSSETDDDPGENVAEDEGEGKPDKTPKASRSPKPRSREGCPAGFEGNHGRFVSESDDKQAAAHSPCGKPERKDKKDKPEKSPKPEKTPKPAKDESSDG
jgi:hypothetical protein